MDEITSQIEIALRDGVIDELTDSTITSIDLIARLTKLVKQQEQSIEQWEIQNLAIVQVLRDAVAQRDSARALAIRLEEECASCKDSEHHGSY